MVLGRYPAFYRRLLESSSAEVRVMASLAAEWAQTVTARNLAHLRNLTNLNPLWDSLKQLKQALPIKQVPEVERWRLGLLDKLMEMRTDKQRAGSDIKNVTAMISSLCST